MLLSYFLTDFKSSVKYLANYTILPVKEQYMRIFNNTKYLDDEIKKLQEENDNLKKINTKLELDNQILQRNTDEYNNLLEINSLKNTYNSFNLFTAKIISKMNNSISNTFIINKGSNDGIKINMNVIEGKGLVGIVEKVNKNTSIVRPIINNNCYLSCVVRDTKDFCIANGDSSKSSYDRLFFNQMNNNDNKISTGSEVITSEISDKFYPGLTVGYISDIKVDSNNLTRSGYISTAVSFDTINYVLVISAKDE